MDTNKDKTRVKRNINQVKLHSLLEVTKGINENLKVDELLKIFQHVLVHDIRIGKLVLFLNNEGWRCVLKHGIKNEFEEIQVETDLLRFKEITDVKLVSSSTNIDSFDVIIPVFHKKQALAYLLIGDMDENKLEISPTIKHLPFIQTLTNIIVVAIENKKLAKEFLRQEGVKKEMELAKQMQNMLFPSSLPNDERLEISALYQPHQLVGGDYYDFIRLNNNEVAFCLADVSGKGVSAALLMANFQANLRALFRTNTSLTEIVNELNHLVMENAKGEKFITLFLAKYNTVTRVINYINAGHNPPLLISEGNVMQLFSGCIGLGMLDEIPRVREGYKNISPEALLICFTDGVTEQEDPAGEQFGLDRFSELLLKRSRSPIKELNDHIIHQVNQFRHEVPYVDDITLFSCRFH